MLAFQLQPEHDAADDLGQMQLWALVDAGNPTERRSFRLFGTGNTIDPWPEECLEHVGTVQMAGGRLVWHLFESSTMVVE